MRANRKSPPTALIAHWARLVATHGTHGEQAVRFQPAAGLPEVNRGKGGECADHVCSQQKENEHNNGNFNYRGEYDEGGACVGQEEEQELLVDVCTVVRYMRWLILLRR